MPSSPPFVQLNGGLNRQYPGTGLGLSLVQRLVALQDGDLSVESEALQGSRFRVSLPWKRQEPAPSAQPVQETPATGSRDERGREDASPEAPLVLIAEDDESNLLVLSDFLNLKGYRIASARNGLEALEETRRSRPAAILMDMGMPGMSGQEAIQRIRMEPGMSDVPIIALTGMAMPGDREKLLAIGASEYLSKPVSLKTLAETIEREMERAGRRT